MARKIKSKKKEEKKVTLTEFLDTNIKLLQKRDPRVRDELQQVRNLRIALLHMSAYIKDIVEYWENPEHALATNCMLSLKKIKKNVDNLIDFVPIDIDKKRDSKAFYTLANNLAGKQNILAKETEKTNPELYIDITLYKHFGEVIAGHSANIFVMWEIALNRLKYIHPDSKKHVTQIKQGISVLEKLMFDSILTEKINYNYKKKENALLEIIETNGKRKIKDNGWKWLSA